MWPTVKIIEGEIDRMRALIRIPKNPTKLHRYVYCFLPVGREPDPKPRVKFMPILPGQEIRYVHGDKMFVALVPERESLLFVWFDFLKLLRLSKKQRDEYLATMEQRDRDAARGKTLDPGAPMWVRRKK